ncbi:MAG TPA: hypothetical protein VN722_07335 [Hanamia sp.]|nr:hypothetical protein [Hanamia sp.]
MSKCNVPSHQVVIKQNTKMYSRYFRLIIILLPLCIISCKKEKTLVSPSIIGTWELRTLYSGWIGNTNYPAGNGNYLKFSESTFEIDTNQVLLNSGTYILVREKFNLTGEMGYRIIYNHEDNSDRTFVVVSNDSLTLSQDAYDGGGALYIRLE